MDEKFYIRVKDVKDKSKLNRINYLFRTKQITKYVDKYGYVVFDQDQYANVIEKKRGKKVKWLQV